MPTGARRSAAVRRRRIRERFDASVHRERHRYSREAWRLLVGELRDRFLARHLPKGDGWVLELGPGPGRFTPTVLASGARVAAVDFSRPMLRTLGRRKAVRARCAQLRRVRAVGERLPFRSGAFRASIALGNILGFSAGDGAQLLREIARVTRPGGLLVLDVASPVGATTDFLEEASRRRLLRRILRNPKYYFLDEIVRSAERTHQPYAPRRWGFFEFDFYTVAAAKRLLLGAGFRPIDQMAIGAIGAYRERLTTIARREPRTWRTLLELEERVGRRAGVLETGHGFVVAALRDSRDVPRRSRGRPQESYRTPRSRAAHVLS